jgi:hypothetical protein
MWLWECELREAGFRLRSAGYWRCERRFGLPAHAYVSIFAGGEAGGGRRAVEVSAFHVTFQLGTDRLHFYYHERAEDVWEPGGHTSAAEIGRYGVEPRQLRDRADEIAARVTAALQGALLPRE